MKHAVKVLSVSLMIAMAGCGGGAKNSTAGADASGNTKPALNAGKSQNGATPQKEEQLVQPPDAAWTIACTQFKGFGHVQRSNQAKQQLKTATGWPGFYVVHEDELSTLYYGFYRAMSPRERNDMSRDEVKDGERAQADLQRIRGLRDPVNDDQLMPQAGLTPLEPADPAAPADWNLLNVDANKRDGDPTKAFWSLEIAIYKDSPSRKKDAVDSVKQLREHFKRNDIYYYHGKTTSSICIGVWPPAAVVETTPDRGNPNERLLVMPQGPLANMSNNLKDSTGTPVRQVSIKLEPVDPTLLDTMSKFPNRSVNGYDIKHTYTGKAGKIIEVYDPSVVIPIPRNEPAGMLGNDQRNTGEPTPSLLNPNPGNTGGGRLKSLEGGK